MFNKGDNVFFLKDNKIHSGTVHKTCAKEVSGEIVTEDSFYRIICNDGTVFIKFSNVFKDRKSAEEYAKKKKIA